jgi:hypothetical protein
MPSTTSAQPPLPNCGRDEEPGRAQHHHAESGAVSDPGAAVEGVQGQRRFGRAVAARGRVQEREVNGCRREDGTPGEDRSGERDLAPRRAAVVMRLNRSSQPDREQDEERDRRCEYERRDELARLVVVIEGHDIRAGLARLRGAAPDSE